MTEGDREVTEGDREVTEFEKKVVENIEKDEKTMKIPENDPFLLPEDGKSGEKGDNFEKKSPLVTEIVTSQTIENQALTSKGDKVTFFSEKNLKIKNKNIYGESENVEKKVTLSPPQKKSILEMPFSQRHLRYRLD